MLNTGLLRGQFTDPFADGNITGNPAWGGNTADWIVNSDLQLQSNNTLPNSNFYLSTANTLSGPAQWDFWARLAFNTSGANYVDVYLTASQSNITLSNTSGYFVRLGDTPDEVSLYRKDANGSSTKIIDGADGLLNSSNNILRIRVIRDAANRWTLSRDMGATGAYTPEGSVSDASLTGSSFFGLWVRQSTASFFQRHYFDDFEVKAYAPDITPPAVVSVTPTSASTLEILFDETLETTSALTIANYSVNNGVGNPSGVAPDPGNPQRMRLNFCYPFPNGTTCNITLNGIKDIAGNTLNNGSYPFSFYTPQRYDILMNELMADPTPQVGLPNANWIELINTSAFPINLQGFRLGRAAGLSGPLPSYFINPGEIVIVCTGSQVSALSPYGTTLSVTSFPTLPNTGDLVWLQDATAKIMHAVEYNIGWYQNAVKAEGGWSLEMIDAKTPVRAAATGGQATIPAGVHPENPTAFPLTTATRWHLNW